MAAATEWLNALDAGAEVVSVRRREPLRRPLNLPRPLFSKRGLRRFHATPPAERAALLAELSAPSYPPGRAWDEPVERAAEEGRFRVAASVNGEEEVICATGFQRGYVHDPLLRRLASEHGVATSGRWLVLAPDSTVPALTDETRTLGVAGVQAQWAYPAVRHARRDEVRRPPIRPQGEGMSYTLRGRLESRLAASILPFLAACALSLGLGAWWPLELAGAMIGAGLALDVGLYHRLLPYQPAWAALPLGLLELTATIALVRLFDVAAPLEPALWFFFGSWVLAQVLAHAGWPLARLTYAEDGGELGRGGLGLFVLAPAALVVVLGTAVATQPPTVRLTAGVHQGPIVIRTSQVLQGEKGAIVRGGIVIRASDVTIRDVAVVGGEYGFDVEHADNVRLERVSVSDAKLDGIHARRSSVTVRDCRIDSVGNRWAQGIDISFSFDKHPSRVTACTVVGGMEGIVTHFTMARIDGNHVSRTALRAISMTEMSMGEISDNEVWDALGIGIFCNDMSMCDVDGNVVVATRPDRASGDTARIGYGVLSSYHAEVELGDNELRANPVPVGTVADAHVVRK